MSKYDGLWEYISAQSGRSITLSYAEIEIIARMPIDHSFLNFKKELLQYGWQVKKISMKGETVSFERTVEA